jgi:membrane protease YdiL (CAAX protease family)
MAAVKLAVALVHRVVAGSWPAFGHEQPIVILAAIIMSTPFQSGEEIGWRGYALPRLAERIGYALGSVVLGLIWALWHLPLFFLPGADKYGQSFPVWALGSTALSVALAWVYTHTNGSLLLTMVMHSAVNQTIGIVPSASASASNPFTLKASLVMWLTTVFLWVAGAYFLIRMPNMGLPRAEPARQDGTASPAAPPLT